MRLVYLDRSGDFITDDKINLGDYLEIEFLDNYRIIGTEVDDPRGQEIYRFEFKVRINFSCNHNSENTEEVYLSTCSKRQSWFLHSMMSKKGILPVTACKRTVKSWTWYDYCVNNKIPGRIMGDPDNKPPVK